LSEETILALGRIYLNRGKRGLLVELRPEELTKILNAVPVRIEIERRA